MSKSGGRHRLRIGAEGDRVVLDNCEARSPASRAAISTSDCFPVILQSVQHTLSTSDAHESFDTPRAEVAQSRKAVARSVTSNEDAACYSRYSSDKQDQESIADQLRECRDVAIWNNHGIPDFLHFSDEAVLGATVVKVRLDALRESANQGRIQAVRVLAKAGTLSIIAVYPEGMTRFPIGMAMLKNLTVQTGNCHHRKYIPRLTEAVLAGNVDPLRILTEIEPLTDAISAYKAFDKRKAGWMKVELKPGA